MIRGLYDGCRAEHQLVLFRPMHIDEHASSFEDFKYCIQEHTLAYQNSQRYVNIVVGRFAQAFLPLQAPST